MAVLIPPAKPEDVADALATLLAERLWHFAEEQRELREQVENWLSCSGEPD